MKALWTYLEVEESLFEARHLGGTVEENVVVVVTSLIVEVGTQKIEPIQFKWCLFWMEGVSQFGLVGIYGGATPPT